MKKTKSRDEKGKAKKKKRVSFRDPLEREEADISAQSRHSLHKVSAKIVDISSMLENPAYQVELSDYDMPQISFDGGYNRPCMSGVCWSIKLTLRSQSLSILFTGCFDENYPSRTDDFGFRIGGIGLSANGTKQQYN